MNYHIRNVTLLLFSTALVGWFTLSLLLDVSPAIATIRQIEEAPGQVVYQSRQVLKDQHGDRWQLIAFNRVGSNNENNLQLRVVGFPGIATIDHNRPLMITTTLGRSLMAPDTSRAAFAEDTAPQPNIGQYDLQDVLADLNAFIPVRLTLPLIEQPDGILSVSPAVLKEWKTLMTHSEHRNQLTDISTLYRSQPVFPKLL